MNGYTVKPVQSGHTLKTDTWPKRTIFFDPVVFWLNPYEITSVKWTFQSGHLCKVDRIFSLRLELTSIMRTNQTFETKTEKKLYIFS